MTTEGFETLSLTCRECREPIQVDTVECPHCGFSPLEEARPSGRPEMMSSPGRRRVGGLLGPVQPIRRELEA
jgi:Uncharacterised protein family UPF0547